MSVDSEALVAVAREYIRSEGRDVGIYQVLEELSYTFGVRIPNGRTHSRCWK